MMRGPNHHPSVPMDDAEAIVRREGGHVHLVYMKNALNGFIRYSRAPGGAMLSQAFHRSWMQALRGKQPFRT